jgi:hypothetical protein
MSIGTIETFVQVLRKLVYGRADGMPNSLESMVVCDVIWTPKPYISTPSYPSDIFRLLTWSGLPIFISSLQHYDGALGGNMPILPR